MSTELSDYLKQHSTLVDRGLHNELIDEIADNLPLIGISGQSNVHKEVELVEGKRVIGSVDIVVEILDGLYVIEGKTLKYGSPDSRSTIKAVVSLNRELRKASRFFDRNFSTKPRKIGIFRYNGQRELRFYELDVDANFRKAESVHAIAYMA